MTITVELSIILFCYLALMYLVTYLKRDNNFANLTWRGGVIITALYLLFRTNNFFARQILVTTLLTIWGIRLCFKFYNHFPKNHIPYSLLSSFVWIFFLQGTLMLIMSYPAILLSTSTEAGLNKLDFIGTLVCAIGLFPYSKLTNYSDEIMWWGIFLIMLSTTFGFTTIVSALAITLVHSGLNGHIKNFFTLYP